MAAGEGQRLRPLTERYAKPVLPIDGRPVIVTRVLDDDPVNPLAAAPLWRLGESFDPALLGRLGGPPFELAEAFQRLIDAGEPVRGIEIGPTRDLTHPLDLVQENFSYLRGL